MLEVRKIPKEMTYEWLNKKHYAHRVPSITYSFGLYLDKVLNGVCTFGSPPSHALVVGIFGYKHEDIIVELNRLCINDGMPDNTASYFVSHALKQLPKPTVVVSYADTSVGHVGYIYQACNFLYTGLSAKRTEWKIKGLEHLHSKTISDGMTVQGMQAKYGDDFYYEDRAQKHRYLYFVCDKTTRRDFMAELKYPVLPYPKGETKRYDASYKPAGMQGILV